MGSLRNSNQGDYTLGGDYRKLVCVCVWGVGGGGGGRGWYPREAKGFFVGSCLDGQGGGHEEEAADEWWQQIYTY
jgi:hypothetical protein